LQNNNDKIHSDIEDVRGNEVVPYINSLDLHSLPFTAEIPEAQYFVEPERQQYLDQLTHLVQSSDMVLVVIGEQGTGKSTLLKQFYTQASDNLHCCTIKAELDFTEHNLLASVSRCLGLPDNLNTQVMSELIREHVTQLQRSDRIPVILVDDAYRLPEDTLHTLLQLQHNQNENNALLDSPWRIVLFTQPSHSPELIQLNDRLHFIQLANLNIEQTKQYLSHRLKTAGYKGVLPFSEKDLIVIQKNSQGNLARIHQQAHEILLDKHTSLITPRRKQAKSTSPAYLKPGVIMSFFAVLVLSSVLFFQGEINNLIQSPDNETVTADITSTEQPATTYTTLKSIPDSKPVNWSEIPALSLDQKPHKTGPKEAPRQADIKQVVKKPEPRTKSASLKTDKPDKTTLSPATAEISSLKSLLSKNHIKGKDWILKQDKTAITSQLMASSKPDALIKHANNSALKGKTAIYHIMRKKGDWYVLVYGNARDRASMQKAIRTLPTQLQKYRPWIRPFNDVQTEVLAGKK